MKGSLHKFTALLLSLLLLPAVLPLKEAEAAAAVWDGSVAAGFSGGTGERNDPYLISNGAELAYLGAFCEDSSNFSYNRYYKLTADIYLNDVTDFANWANKAPAHEWKAMCTYDTGGDFSGFLDGNGHTVYGLYINKTGDTEADNCQGLFSAFRGGSVFDLTLSQAYVKGNSNVGGFVGYAKGAVLINCSVSGVISGKTSCGGFAGFLQSYGGDSSVIDCENFAAVSGNTKTGGLVGGMTDSSLLRSVNSGAVSGYIMSGGLVGWNKDSLAMDCLNTGSVSGTYLNGGIAGWNAEGTLKNCVNTGSVSGTVCDALAGQGGGCTDCYYLAGCCETAANGVSLTASALKSKSSFPSFDFTNVWAVSAKKDTVYPMALLDKSEGEDSAVWDGSVAFSFASGSGTAADPYIITTAAELALVAYKTNVERDDLQNQYFALGNDIILNDTSAKNWILKAAVWDPIGNGTSFTGRFDGRGHAVRGLYSRDVDSSGLFGYCYSLNQGSNVISNLGVADSYITGGNYAGGVLAQAYYSTLQNCFSTATVYSPLQTGGLAGYVCEGIVTCCYSDGQVVGAFATGGLIGNDNACSISSCYSADDVTGYSNVGGLCGVYAVGYSTPGKIEACYTAGKVSCTQNGGAAVGLAYSYSAANTLSFISVYYRSDSGMESMYTLGEYNEGTVSDDSAPLSLTKMQLAESFAGFDFESIWTMEGNPDYLYPELIGNNHYGSSSVVYPFMLGDVDRDGSITALDASLVLRHTVHLLTLQGEAFTAGDVDGNEVVNAQDASLILRYVVKLILSFPAAEA